MARNRTALWMTLLAMTLLPAVRAAGDIVVPKPEAPTTIFSTQLGSVDVDLSLLGSWTAGVSFGTGMLLQPGLGAQWLDSFPSFDTGFLFTQTPDITLSLDLLKHYFLSVSILGDFSDNAIQMGYRGSPGDVLQSVILGTQGVTIAPSTFLQVPSQPAGSLGASASFSSGGSTNDLLLRWDAAPRKTKTFVGRHELVEQHVSLDSYTKGMYFFLPDAGIDSGSLKVYIQDPDGTYKDSQARTYRLATYDDVIVDSTNGLVSLRNALKTRVLVYYTKGGISVGNTSGATLPALDSLTHLIRDLTTTVPFTWSTLYFNNVAISATRQVAVAGVGNALLLWEPGDNSPFEIDNSYAFSSTPPADVSQISISLQAKATTTLPTGIVFKSYPSDKRFTAIRNLSARDFTDFYPFTDSNGLIYGPNRDSLSGSLDYEIYAQFLTPVDTFTLESNIVAGSVQVTINGVSTDRFTADASSGTLVLKDDVLPTDRIVVTWEKADSSSSGGDILFAWRDVIPLSDSVSLSLSTGIRWNANPWSYSQEAYSKSGTIIAEAGIQGTTGPVSYAATAAVSYTNPDTSGILRLFGMEGDSTSIGISEEYAYPASVPDNAEIPGLLQSNRGYLYYRNYRTYDALGNATLHTIDLSPAPAVTAYASGGRMGPYSVVGSDGNLGAQSLVLEYALSTSNPWVGTQIPVSSGSDVDLSSARSLTIRLRGRDMDSSVSVYVQMGAVSEDLDGSGSLRAEASSADTGFAFVDAAHSVQLKVGAGPQLTGNGILDTEDRNANGVLDYEDATRVVTKGPGANAALTVATSDTSWKTVTLTLSDADRAALVKTRGVRIIVLSAGTANGKILIDTISVQASPFAPVATSSAASLTSTDRGLVGIRQVAESLSASDPGAANRLDAKFSTTYNRFHSTGDTNEVLEVSATGATSTPYSVKGFLALGSTGTSHSTGGIQYQTIMSYVRSVAGGTYTFNLWDASGVRISWKLTLPADNTWHEVRVSRADSTVTVDGAASTSYVLSQFDSSYGDLVSFTIDMPTGANTVYVDEVYATDPLGAVGAAFVGNVAAHFDGPIVSIGGVALLSNVVLRQDVSLTTAGFSSLYGTPASAEDLSARTHAEADLLFTRTTADFTVRETAGAVSVYGSHSITVPATASPVGFLDAFSLTNAGGFSRENRLTVSPGSHLNLTLDTTADASPDESDTTGQLTQTWAAALSAVPISPLTLSSLLTMSQAVAGYTLPSDWYGGRWVREAALVLPWLGGSDVQRKESLDLKAGIPAAPVGFSAEASTSAYGTTYSGGTFTQESKLSLSVGTQVKLGEPDTSLSLSYNRDLSLTTTPAMGERFITETTELARLLSLQGYILGNLPIAEIFSDNAGSIIPSWTAAGVTEGSYAPSLSVSLSRGYGSRLLDLFLPSSLELAVGQELEKSTDLSQTLAFIRPKTTTRAVNLFGSLGAYPVIPWIRTDEYSLSLGASLDGSPSTTPILSTLSVEALASMTGLSEEDLTLINTLKRTESTTETGSVVFSNDTQALFNWKVRPRGGVPLPLLAPEVASTGHFEHAENAELTLAWQQTGTYYPVTAVIGHATSLVFDKYGTIKASLDLGMSTEDLGSTGIAWRFAIRAAIEAKLTF